MFITSCFMMIINGLKCVSEDNFDIIMGFNACQGIIDDAIVDLKCICVIYDS